MFRFGVNINPVIIPTNCKRFVSTPTYLWVRISPNTAAFLVVHHSIQKIRRLRSHNVCIVKNLPDGLELTGFKIYIFTLNCIPKVFYVETCIHHFFVLAISQMLFISAIYHDTDRPVQSNEDSLGKLTVLHTHRYTDTTILPSGFSRRRTGFSNRVQNVIQKYYSNAGSALSSS